MSFLQQLLKNLIRQNHPVYNEFLFNNQHTSIAILDTNFNFIKVNSLYAEQNGCKPEDYPGKNHFALYPCEEAELIFRNVITNCESYHCNAGAFRNLLHPEKPVTYWDWSLVPVKDKQGKVDTLILQLIDVTGRINALDKSEERFAKAFNYSPALMTIRDLETGKYLAINDAWLKNTGYSREITIGNTPQKINLCIDRDPLDLVIRKGKNMTNKDIQYNTKSGQLREGLYSTEIIEIDGNPCLLTALVDITQRKTMEKELFRLDRLSLIGQMAAGIGHEIRNPLTTIRGFLQILGMKEKYTEDRDYFQLMISEVDRTNSIITEFLSLSKTRPENLSISNLNLIIETLTPLLQAQALQLDRQIKFIPGDIPDTFVCEKELRQLILNMVTNGLDVSPPGGTVFIQTQQENDYILLSIKDQGPGIDPQIIPRLGTPFLTTKPQGTGLGLAICYSIVERHAGYIQVDTGLTGTNFIIHFPICTCEKIGA